MTESDSTGVGRLLDEAINLLATRGIEALEAALSFSVLGDKVGYARQTVYNHFGSGTDAVGRVAEHLFDLETSKFRETFDAVMATYRMSDESDRPQLFRLLLGMNFVQQFSGRALPAGWLLHGAALCRSGAWSGQPRPAHDEKRDLVAEAVLRVRADFYDAMGSELEVLLAMATRAVGRELAPETTTAEVVLLMNALFDGLVLRATLHPDRVSPELVGRALYALAEAFTVEGGVVADARRPSDERLGLLFDAMARATVDQLRHADAEPTVDAMALAAGVDLETATTLFPSWEVLLESAARRLVPGEEMAAAVGHPYPVDIVSTALDALAANVEANRLLFHLLSAESEVLSHFRRAVAEALESGVRGGSVNLANPTATATTLVRFALQGAAGRDALGGVIEAIGPASADGACNG